MANALLQTQELEALQAIFQDDFSLTTTKTAWKAANAAHEFIIRVHPLEDVLKDRVGISVHFKLPLNYPRVSPSISLENPLGLTADVVASLETRLKNASHSNELHGTEMCFELCSMAAQVITDRHAMVLGQTSLRQEAEQRAEADRKDLEARDQAQLQTERLEREEQQARLMEMVQADRERRVKLAESAETRPKPPTRTLSIPRSLDVPSIQLLQPFTLRGGKLATLVSEGSLAEDRQLVSTFHAQAFSEDMTVHQSVSLHLIHFPLSFSTSPSSKRKLHGILDDIKRAATVSHPNLQRLFAWQLTDHVEELRLEVVTEPHCHTGLDVLLQATGPLTEERAMPYMRQIASALAGLHAAGVTHNALRIDMILLHGKKAAEVRLIGASWIQRLDDLNRTEPFAPASTPDRLPERWLCPEAVTDPLSYGKARDMFELGCLFLHIVLGCNVTERYPSVVAATHSAEFSNLSYEIAEIIKALLEPHAKKRMTASRLAENLERLSMRVSPVSPCKLLSGWQAPFGSDMTALKTVKAPSEHLNGVSALAVENSPQHSKAVTKLESKASYFWQPHQQNISQVSRYRTDFEEVEFLGKGGFGQVVKARNRLDGSYYAVKKIRMPTSPEAEQKLLREVTIWSRMTHPHIVRYHTAWTETDQSPDVEVRNASASLSASATMSNSSMSSGVSHLSVDEQDFDLGLDDIDFDDSDFLSVSRSASYPRIRFANDDDPSTAPSPEESNAPQADASAQQSYSSPAPSSASPRRTLYIQMEFVGGGASGQTLREAIDGGLAEDESWRLLRQILSAMQHFTSINILHRDLKPSNIFLDAHGDVRVGDFGLAVEQAAAGLDTFALTPTHDDAVDLTSDVGTGLYVAPEMKSRGAGAKPNGTNQPYNNKIDMYSLGIVCFEMWHPIATAMERVQLLRDLRTPEIKLPPSWTGNERQSRILKWMLCHDPSERASPADLLQSELLPSTGRNEAVENVIRMVQMPRSPHRPPILSALMTQSADERLIRDLTYEITSASEASADLDSHLNVVTERLRDIFERRGALHMPNDLVMPLSDLYEKAGRKPFKLIDSDGTVLQLPYDLTTPLARKVAREPHLGRLKRWTIGQVFRPRPAGGPPEAITAASFDIVTSFDTVAAEAEIIQMLDEVASAFPLGAEYTFVVNHANLLDFALEQVPATARNGVIRVLETFSKKGFAPWTKIASELLKQRDLTRRIVDTLAPFHFLDDASSVLKQLETIKRPTATLDKALEDLRSLLTFCQRIGVTRPIKIWPLFLANRTHFDHGRLYFQLSQPQKTGDVLAVGGRYDRLLSHFAPLGGPVVLPHMTGASIAVAKLAQAAAQDTLVAGQRAPPDYGTMTPRRCDVYVMSYASGLLESRMHVVSQLWQHGIAADLMYDERDWSGQSAEQAAATWRKEGILFVVIVKQAATGDQIVRVKSVLRGGEEDVLRIDLPSYLSDRLQEQAHPTKTVEATSSFGQVSSQGRQVETLRPTANNVQFIGDELSRKQRARNRQLVSKAVEQIGSRLDTADAPPVFALDCEREAFKLMCESPAWLSRDDAFRALVAASPPGRKSYLASVRADIQAFRTANPRCSWIWLYSMRENASGLLSLP